MKPLRVLLPLFAAGACSLVAPRLPGADEVLRQAPAAYQETLAPLLTTLAAATGIDAKALEEKAPGITLLDERLYTLREDGRRLIARQLVRKALTDAGAHGMADEIFTFRRKEQKFYLLTAETIQPDGTVQAVGPDAVLVNSPQRQAQYALYDDQAEVRIIFPNVKPGSITHAVVVIEDVRARMPGQFTEMFTWTSNWPYGRVHYVVDLPPALAARLKIHMVGRDVPAVTRMEQPDGHVRFASEKTLIRPSLDETSPAPAEQVGPCLHLSTVPDWGAVGRWYGGLLKGRDQLTPALAKQVDTWTKDAANPDAVVNLLFDKVANDVRYTGLELGEADYQPHDCNAVWENQYGDCKDKANLLLALLRHQGVAANLVLVNASDAGLIDRRSPDFRVFSHAIVALPDDRGGYRFCDPTIARSRPGILSPTDADRDVLVITDDGADWAHTPAMTAGRMDYRFDLGLRPTGELSGWFSLSAEGFYGAMDEDWFRKLDATEGRQAVAEMVRDFYPGAEV
ncbi:MAG TPA: DUF3857 and transglutaminase domain-containing protein, partial [Acidimicrobiales bacterium]|nr:DUF3857 and transglutaminase domain-containing protein [Acidimicrobiales bacterium]